MVRQADERIEERLAKLKERRTSTLVDGRNKTIEHQSRRRLDTLSERRATLIVEREERAHQVKATAERLNEMQRYRDDLENELDRLNRAEDAGALFADLKVTHCPACDQTVSPQPTDVHHCHLCHQHLPADPVVEGLGAARLKFENERLSGELKEAESLVAVLAKEAERLARMQIAADEELRMIENELAPAREAVSAFVNEELSEIDMALGELNERQRQVRRLTGALELGDQLTAQIKAIEKEISPLQDQVDERIRSTDFGHAEELIAQGMGAYLDSLNLLKANVWRHSAVSVDLSRSSFSIKVGSRRWSIALGGTDTLYFLMAYHYGLLSLSSNASCHYPGLSVIDLPGDFLGESIEDKENFIVQPFIDLLDHEAFAGAQVIMTGASFKGLTGVHRTNLNNVYAG